MRKVLIGLLFLTAAPAFAGGVFADLQWECTTVNKHKDRDIQNILIYDASALLNKNKAIISEYYHLIKASMFAAPADPSTTIVTYGGRAKGKTHLSIKANGRGMLKIGSRNVAMSCKL